MSKTNAGIPNPINNPVSPEVNIVGENVIDITSILTWLILGGCLVWTIAIMLIYYSFEYYIISVLYGCITIGLWVIIYKNYSVLINLTVIYGIIYCVWLGFGLVPTPQLLQLPTLITLVGFTHLIITMGYFYTHNNYLFWAQCVLICTLPINSANTLNFQALLFISVGFFILWISEMTVKRIWCLKKSLLKHLFMLIVPVFKLHFIFAVPYAVTNIYLNYKYTHRESKSMGDVIQLDRILYENDDAFNLSDDDEDEEEEEGGEGEEEEDIEAVKIEPLGPPVVIVPKQPIPATKTKPKSSSYPANLMPRLYDSQTIIQNNNPNKYMHNMLNKSHSLITENNIIKPHKSINEEEVKSVHIEQPTTPNFIKFGDTYSNNKA